MPHAPRHLRRLAALAVIAGLALPSLAVPAAAIDPSAGKPRISRQPQDQYVEVGQTATFSLSTDDEAGRKTATVRLWEFSTDFRTWTEVPDTYDVESITTPPLAPGGRCIAYRARVFGRDYFSQTTREAMLCPLEAPEVKVQPTSQVRREGEAVVLLARAEGAPTPRVTWERQLAESGDFEPLETTPFVRGDGGPFPDFVADDDWSPGGSRLLFTFDPERDNGATFRATFTSAAGTSFSEPAVVTHRSLFPTIDGEPEDRTVAEGEQTDFVVDYSTYTTDHDAVEVQWYRSTDGGETFTAIDGADLYQYVTPAVTAADNGNLFRATVTDKDQGTTANSRPAQLTVAPAGGSALASAGSPFDDDEDDEAGLGLLAPGLGVGALLAAAAAFAAVWFRRRAAAAGPAAAP